MVRKSKLGIIRDFNPLLPQINHFSDLKNNLKSLNHQKNQLFGIELRNRDNKGF